MGNNGSGISRTVLFVDDKPDVLNSIERLFIDRDLKMLRASKADDALDLFKKEDIAVIISDNQMPGMKGTELLGKVRDISPDTLRILMTEYADLAGAVEAANKGEIFRFITRPWNNNMLVRTVQKAVERYQIVRSLKDHDEVRLLSIAQMIELKDHYTHGHCERVAYYALIIAAAQGFSEEAKRELTYGCWLHDCGKIDLPEHILNRKGTLDPEEFEIIKKHPVWGADVARQALLPDTVVKIILHHHERYNGTGYPAGIKGADIPLEARIVTVSDVYDALTTDRPYRERYSIEKVFSAMLSMKGSIFDPELVDILLSKLPQAQERILNP
jgi:putative two-component system response regulator